MAPEHPEWKDVQPFKALLEGDMKALMAEGEAGLIKLVMASHAGMTSEEFNTAVRDWLKTARHPRFEKPMRVCDMISFQAEHDEHHLSMIKELLKLYRSR